MGWQLFRSRFPSKKEAIAVFIVVVFPLHARAYLALFHDVPGYILHLSVWDIVGITGYVQLVALIESLLFLGFFTFISITLPNRAWRDGFVQKSAVTYLILFPWILPIHYQNQILNLVNGDLGKYAILMLGWILLAFVVLSIALTGVHRSKVWQSRIDRLIAFFSPLSSVYLAVDLMLAVVLLIRWLGAS